MNFNRKSKVSADFAMSSMTDLVFLLLIFFMLTSTLVTTRGVDFLLPQSNAQTVKRQDIAVAITKDLEYSIDGVSVPHSALESRILAAAAGAEETTIVLYVEASVPTGTTVEVLDIAMRNQLKMVVATDPKK